MGDFLGPVAIPDPPTISAFPLRSDYGTGLDESPNIASHLFDQPGLKTEQRFLLGRIVRRYRVRKDHLSCDELNQLRAHWQLAQGAYAQFPYTYPTPKGNVVATVHYENPSITFNQLVGMITGDPGVTLLEVNTGTENYMVSQTLTRFPDSAFDAALTGQVQMVIPLIGIQDRANGAPIYISNTRANVAGINGTTLFLPRLLTWSGLTQSIGESSDSVSFTLGNADRVWTQLVNQVNMQRATVSFSLLHATTGTLVNLWKGYAVSWGFDNDGNFQLPCSDGVFELSLAYPSRVVSRKCWKVYKGRFCPSTSSFPDCPKTWEACQERAVPLSFGGMVILPPPRVKDNSSGVFGFGRSQLTSVTVVQDSVYQRAVQEVYTDVDMKVDCDVAGGRDENEFYSALGIVGEGPISGYQPDLIQQRLDDQPPHDPKFGGGWRGIKGFDPALPRDFFALDQAPWNVVPAEATYSAGLAFAEIRRSDAAGLQLAPVSDRKMVVTLTGGIGGWTWTAPGARVWTPKLANCVWVAVNVYLRARGLRVDPFNADQVPADTMEQYFDVDQAIASAAICDLQVPKLVGTGNERQFPFRGILKERKPLKDWLQEIMNCCLGYFTFVYGKLWIGIRENSSVGTGNDYTRATILYKSLRMQPVAARFNWLIGQFGDEEFEWALNNSAVYDIDHASFAGTPESPQYVQNTMTLVGVSNKSQAARVVTTRLREEIGGLGPTEQQNARTFSFRTTILGLRTMVGDIIALNHPDFPTGRQEGRVQQWTLNPDMSIDVSATPTTDLMYDLTFGPKPDDVPSAPVPPELLPAPVGLAWMPNAVAPYPGDPLYPDPEERTFAVQQDYHITRDGVWDPAIYVGGEFPINRFADTVQPRILDIEVGPDGSGTLDGPMTVYVALTQRDANDRPVTPSNLAARFLDENLLNRSIVLTAAPAGDYPVYEVWAGTDRRRIGRQSSVSGALPATVTLAGPIHPMTQGLPEADARAVAVKAKHVWHSGVAGVLVTGVPASDQLQCNDFIGSTENWVGRILSTLADQSDGSAPLWNFRVTAFSSGTGTLTVTPDVVRATPEDSVQEGDVLVVRSIATTADADSVTDTMWHNDVSENQFNSPGLRPDEEIGRVARILRGTGAGQFRAITANTATQLWIAPPWTTIPDETSIVIVEDPDWVYDAHSSQLEAGASGFNFTIRMRVDNLRDEIALVGAFLVDDQGRLTDEEFAVFREIYVFGQPPTVREVGPAKWDPDRVDAGGNPDPGPWYAYATDHNIRADATANEVEIQLPPLHVYEGRSLKILNDSSTDAFNVIVFAYPGEALFDGNTTVTLLPGQTLTITAG